MKTLASFVLAALVLSAIATPARAFQHGGEPPATAPVFAPAASMNSPRSGHTATLLPSGDVLVVGGALDSSAAPVAPTEIYRSATGGWEPGAPMTLPSTDHTATLLPSGKVMIAGGSLSSVSLQQTALFDPSTGRWTPGAPMRTARAHHTATLLRSGRLLVAGGATNAAASRAAEIYDPETDTWTPSASMPMDRCDHSATLLPSGRVLIAGGTTQTPGAPSALLYDPAADSWTPTGAMNATRAGHTATLLASGKVLVSGGTGAASGTADECYDPETGEWSEVGASNASKTHTATLLPSGKVLAIGDTTTASIYDPATSAWTATGPTGVGRAGHTATRLLSGGVLVVGGSNHGAMLASAELVSDGIDASAQRPVVDSATPSLLGSYQLRLAGHGFAGQTGGSGETYVRLQGLEGDAVKTLSSEAAQPSTDTLFVSEQIAEFPSGYASVTLIANGIPSVAKVVLLTASETALTIEPEYPTAEQNVVLQATVAPSSATGMVRFMDGIVELGSAPITNGAAQMIANPLSLGDHALFAVYDGDSSIPSSTSLPVQVAVGTPVATVEFESASYVVQETSGAITIPVRRSGLANVTATVAYETAWNWSADDNYADSYDDYTTTQGTLSFGPGETEATIVIPILDDTLYEVPESFLVKLLKPGPTGVALGGTKVTCVTIASDDRGAVLKFTHGWQQVEDNCGLASVAVERSALLDTAVTARVQAYSWSSLKIAPGFELVTDTVTFAPGQTNAEVQVRILDDPYPYYGETLFLVLSGMGPGVQVDPSHFYQFVYILSSSDSYATVGFETLQTSVDRSLGQASVQVRRLDNTEIKASVAFETYDISAVAGSDYVAHSGTVTFEPGERAKTIDVEVFDGASPTGSELVGLRLKKIWSWTSTPESLAVWFTKIDNAETAVELLNSDQDSTFSFEQPSYTIEEGRSVALTVSRMGGLTSTETVAYSTGSNGMATPGVDYQPQSGLLAFAPQQTSATIVVPTLDDTRIEELEDFYVSIDVSGPTAKVGAIGTTNVKIVDDEGPCTVSFEQPSYTVGEQAGSVTLTVIRTGERSSEMSVGCELLSTSSAGSADFGTVSGNIAFAPGVTSATVTIDIFDDTLAEGRENFAIQLTPHGFGTIIGTRGVAVVEIEDDDAPTRFDFAQSSYVVNESAGTIQLQIVRANDISTPAQVTVMGYSGTASSAGDFLNRPQVVSFAANQTSASTVIHIIDDGQSEAVESFFVELTDPSQPGVVGPMSTAVVTITDDETGSTFQVADPLLTLSERSGRAVVTVTRTGDVDRPAMVDYVTVANTAVSTPTWLGDTVMPPDFTHVSGVVVFAPGQTSATVAIEITDDQLGEGFESFFFALIEPSGDGALGPQTATAITIVDDDSADAFVFRNAWYYAIEGTTVDLTIVRTSSSGQAIEVPWAMQSNTATIGVDTDGPIGGSLAFGPTDTAKTISIPLRELPGDGPVKSFVVALEQPNVPNFVPGPGQQTVVVVVPEIITVVNGPAGTNSAIGTIVDQGDYGDYWPASGPTLVDASGQGTPQTPGFKFDAAVYSATEDQGHVTVKITRSNSARPQTVRLTTTDFSAVATTAAASGDYEAKDVDVVFDAGVASKEIDIAITADGLYDEGTEYLNASLSNPSTGATIGTLSNAVVAIALDPVNTQAGQFRFGAPIYSVVEGSSTNSTTATIAVERVGGAVGAVSVRYTTLDLAPASGNAGSLSIADSSDYTSAAGAISFADGETSKTFTVTIQADSQAEGVESLNLKLHSPKGGAALNTNSNALLAITDDDDATVNAIQFGQPVYSVVEGVGTLTIEVKRIGKTSGSATVKYRTKAVESAAPENDYLDEPGELTFGSGETTKTFAVQIVNPSRPDPESLEVVDLELTQEIGVDTFVIGTAVLIIEDDDN